MHCTFARSFNEHPNSLSLRSLICNTFIEGHPNFSRTSFFVVGMTYSLFYRYNSSCTVFWVSSFHLSVMHLSMLCRRGGRAWGRDLNVFVGPGVGHLLILFSQGRGYLNLSSPDVEIFDCRLGRKRLRTNICFPLPSLTHAPYGLERSGNHRGQREQAKARWISLCFFQIWCVLACF